MSKIGIGDAVSFNGQDVIMTIIDLNNSAPEYFTLFWYAENQEPRTMQIKESHIDTACTLVKK